MFVQWNPALVTFLKGPLLSVQAKLPYMFIFFKKTLFVHSPIGTCNYNLYYFYLYTAIFIFLLLSFYVLFKFLFKEFIVHSRCVLKNSCLGYNMATLFIWPNFHGLLVIIIMEVLLLVHVHHFIN